MNASRDPRVTVLMSVFNGERYLRQAIDSILGQAFSDFEFLIVDDGSTDRSAAIVSSYDDSRIRLVRRANAGLPAALNAGLELACGEYVARQDADDISEPDRLARLVAYLDAHPDVGLVGSNYTIVDEEGRPITTTRLFTHPDDLALAELLSNQFGHGSVMMRRELVRSLGGYDSGVGYVEDYDLWVRISQVAKVANLPEPLYLWRRTDEGITLSKQKLQVEQAYRVRDLAIARFLASPRRFRVLSSWHPRSFRPDARVYFDRKAVVLRDLAYLCRRDGRWWRALVLLLVSAVVAPYRRRYAFRLILRHLRYRGRGPVWEYEYV